LMREVGLLARDRIRRRTQAGISVSGAPFTPLSAGYAQQKQKHLGTSRADLTVSGRMLNDMQVVDTTERTATIGFISGGSRSRTARRIARGLRQASGRSMTFIQRSREMGAADKAFYHQEGGRMLRPFFDLNDEDERAITAAVERYLDRVIDSHR